jgi:pimeloyl-ACP methyl ester carboxylesterase
MAASDDDASMGGWTHHRIAACGISLHAVEVGAGPLHTAEVAARPLMVLASGWPQTWYSWRKIMPALAQHFHVVAVDLPGLGDSDFPAAGYDTGSISLNLDAVLHAFGARECTLVTHDIGTWVGYAYAARRPERVRRLVLSDANIPGLAPPEVFRFAPETATKVWHFYFNLLADLPEILILGREREFLTWLFRTKSADWATAFDPAALDVYVQAYAAPGRWSAGLGYYRAIFDSGEQNRATAATKLAMPVLAIGGSSGLGEAMAQTAGHVAKTVQGAVIEHCGHYIPEERPAELLALILPFSLA